MTQKLNKYFVYVYLRDDLTPYYVGKGSGYRATTKHTNVETPSADKIMYIKTGVDEATSLMMERFWISVFGREDLGTGPLVNRTTGGQNGRLGPASKQLVREKTTGRRFSDEHIAKLKAARAKQVCTDETKAKRRAARLGKKMSDESKAKCSANHNPNSHSAEQRRKQSIAKKGKILTDEHKQKVGAGLKKAYAEGRR